MMIRGPIYRLVIVSTIGLQAAAVFDIAMRVTQTVREVIATGFSVLFPSFSILCRSGDQARIIELIQVSLMVLLSLGALSLGLLIGVVAPMLSLWLGDFPAELVPSTRVLAIWQIITLANVPFWYLLQATHNERIAAYSIWAHTSAIILVVPFSNAFTVGIVELLVYWTVTSVFTQGLIYFHVQRRLELLWASVLAPRILALLALVIGYSVFSYWVSTSVGDTWSLAASFIFTSAAYIAISGLIVIDPLRKFIEQGANR